MRKLVQGDVDRVLRKWNFWGVLILLFLIVFCFIFYQNTTNWNGLAFISAARTASLFPTIILMGIVLYMDLFADEFRSMALITVIGRGMSRTKIIIAKFVDCMILGGIATAVVGAEIFLSWIVFRAKLSPYQLFALVLALVLELWLELMMFLAMSLMVLFLTSNVAVGMFAYVFVSILMEVIFILLEMIPGLVERFHPERYYCGGIAAQARTDFLLGFPGGGIFAVAAGCVIYIALPLTVTALVYRRRELDF